MANKGRYLKKNGVRGRKKKRASRIILGVFCFLLVLILTVGALGAYYVHSKLDKINRAEYQEDTSGIDLDTPVGYFEEEDPEEPTETEEEVFATEVETQPTEPDYGTTGKIINVLLIGQDSRPGEESKLADSIVLFTVNKETKTLTMTSFLRDTFIKMPDYKGHTCGKNRINVNYALGHSWGGDLGAMEMLDLCIYNNFGVQIDGNVEISFGSFQAIVDKLGGLDIELDEIEAAYMRDVAEAYAKIDPNFNGDTVFVEGVNHLDGFYSLHYARMRHSSNDDSDMKRANRQRVVIGQILNIVKTMSLGEINDLVDEFLPMVLTDMETSQISSYILDTLPFLPSLTLVSNQCPADGTAHGEMIDIYGDGGQHGVLVPDVQKNREILMAICESDH